MCSTGARHRFLSWGPLVLQCPATVDAAPSSVLKTAPVPTKEQLGVYSISDIFHTKQGGQYWGCAPDYEHPCAFASEGPASAKGCPNMTIPQFLIMAAEKHPDKHVMRIERTADGKSPAKV